MTDKTKKPCSLVVIRNNKRLTGTAAQVAHISDRGGWDTFLEEVAARVVRDFAEAYNAAARRPRLQVVAGTDQSSGA